MVAVVRAAVAELGAGRVAETRLLGDVSVEKVFQTQRVAVDNDAATVIVLALATSPGLRTARPHSSHRHRRHGHQQQQQQGQWTATEPTSSSWRHCVAY